MIADATPQERLEILRKSRTVALVGVSPNPLRSSNFVATYLARTPYTVWPVNPHADEILGKKSYASLSELPEVVKEAIAVGAKVVWFQLGLRNEEAAQMAFEAGLKVVQDRCLKIEHARFAGGLHLAGFDTGVISSKRRLPV